MEEWRALPWWQQALYLEELQDDPQVRRDRSEEEGQEGGGQPVPAPSAGGPVNPDGSRDLNVGGMRALGIQARQVPAAS